MYTFHDVFVPYVHLPGPMSLDHMYTYQDLCPRIIHILTRTYVLGSYVYTYQDISLDHMYTYTYQDLHVLGSYVYLPGLMSLDHMYTYQDLCPWIICILTRTYVLGSYVYLPGPMDLLTSHGLLCPWIICILTRTYVLGSHVYFPGLMSLDHTYTYQDLGPWKKQQTNKHKTDSYTETKKTGEKYVQTGRNWSI